MPPRGLRNADSVKGGSIDECGVLLALVAGQSMAANPCFWRQESGCIKGRNCGELSCIGRLDWVIIIGIIAPAESGTFELKIGLENPSQREGWARCAKCKESVSTQMRKRDDESRQ